MTRRVKNRAIVAAFVAWTAAMIAIGYAVGWDLNRPRHVSWKDGFDLGYESCRAWLEEGDYGSGVAHDATAAYVDGYESGQFAAGCSLGD